MKTAPANAPPAAFSRLDAIVIVAVLALLAWLLLPTLALTDRGGYWPSVHCMSRLSDLGKALLAEAEATDKGPLDQAYTTAVDRPGELTNFPVVALFQSLSNRLATPEVFACPVTVKSAAANFASLTATNIGYFLAVNRPGSGAEACLAGDRTLTIAGKPARSGPVPVTTHHALGWSKSSHRSNGGSLLFADGHVEHCKPARLSIVFAPPAPASNWLIFP